MTRTPTERERLSGIYERYARSVRSRRAWSADNAGNMAIRDELVARALEALGARLLDAHAVLDAGCGSGWWLERLEHHRPVGAALHGVELLPERAAAARRRAPAAAIVEADVRALPYQDRAFDVVTLFTVLSSMPRPSDAARAIAECRRVLLPGGALLIWEPRLPNPLNRDTIAINGSLLAHALHGTRVQASSITVLPPLARLLGDRTPSWYPRLARMAPLRTHRLVCAWTSPN
jgi:ubiquinone/menaquinone biosynthesis C-methylase UbiE